MPSRRWPKPEPPFSDVPRGRCRWCGETILKDDGTPNGRRRWHPNCHDEYAFQVFPQIAVQKVYKRDRGVCAECGLDTDALWRKLVEATAGMSWHAAVEARWRMLDELGYKGHRANTLPVLWNADHVVPLWEGGEHSMVNLQTLCVPHHAEKTAEEARRRAAARRSS